MFPEKLQSKLKHVLYSIDFLKKILQFMRYVEKYGTARQATDGNPIWHRKDAICSRDK